MIKHSDADWDRWPSTYRAFKHPRHAANGNTTTLSCHVCSSGTHMRTFTYRGKPLHLVLNKMMRTILNEKRLFNHRSRLKKRKSYSFK